MGINYALMRTCRDLLVLNPSSSTPILIERRQRGRVNAQSTIAGIYRGFFARVIKMQLGGSARCRVKDLNPVCNTLVATLTLSEPGIELTQATAQGGQAAGVSPIEGFRVNSQISMQPQFGTRKCGAGV